MNNGDVSLRNLEGPYKHHLYIGYAPANKKIVLDLRARLEKQGVSCCLRATNASIQASIQEGVGTSQKCLLFLTSDYLEDDWYQIETSAVIEKSELFSHDAVIILKSEASSIPERLQEFTTTTYQFKPEKLNDEEFMVWFADIITRELYMNLTVLAKHNNGYGSARNYFYGYLCLILPDFKKRLLDETLKNVKDLVPWAVQKMLIIMPESCFCTPKLDSPNQIEFTDMYVVAVAHRAGNNKRDFKNSLYKLINHEKQQEYYFAAEFATPLLTMYDAYNHGLCGMTKEQMYEERDAFYFTLKSFLSHPGNAGCNDQFKLLFWPDPKTSEKSNQLDLYNFLRPVLSKEILLQQQNESSPPEVSTVNNVLVSSTNPQRLNTFEIVPAHGCNPARVYEDDVVRKYSMDRQPRGLCLIINIANFIISQTLLSPREGAEKDEDVLQRLFKDRHFLVELHKDVSEETLKSLLEEKQNTDHTDYDAFVCCILSHGKLGVIYTSDGKEVEILSLVEFFTEANCPSLEGKPKMFFIQACQNGDPEPESSAALNLLPHYGSTEDHLVLPPSQTTASDSAANAELLPLTTCQMVEHVQELEMKEDAIAVPTMSTLDETLPLAVKCKSVLVPGSPDFLMSYSTLPGSVSYRDTQTGSLYVHALNECLRKDMEIDKELKMVTAHVKEKLRELGDQNRFQLPFHLTSGMYRSIYL